MNPPRPTLSRALTVGSLGFAVVSIAAFSVWAFAGTWLHARVGEAGLYAATAMVFLALSGLLLHSLLPGPGSMGRFYKIFVPAFVGYSILWCAAWFTLGFGVGEWAASLGGSIVFTAVVAAAFRNPKPWAASSVVMFVMHSAGYFSGGRVMSAMMDPAWLSGLSREDVSVIAKLTWGLFYGLGFGAGLGYVLYAFGRLPRER